MNKQELEKRAEVFDELNQGLIDATQRIITDWSVTRDLGPAIEEAQTILKLAREARLQWPPSGAETSASPAGDTDATSGSGPTPATSTKSHAASIITT